MEQARPSAHTPNMEFLPPQICPGPRAHTVWVGHAGLVTEPKVQEEGEARGERHGSRLTYRGVTRHTHTADMGSVAFTKVDRKL